MAEAARAEWEAERAAMTMWDRLLEHIKQKRLFILGGEEYEAFCAHRAGLKRKERVAEGMDDIKWQKARWLYKDGNSYNTPRVEIDRDGHKKHSSRDYDTAWLTVKTICFSEYGTQHTSSLPYKTLKRMLWAAETKLHTSDPFEYTWGIKADCDLAVKVAKEAIRQTNQHLKRNGWIKLGRGDWVNGKRKRTKASLKRELYQRGRIIWLQPTKYYGW